MAFNIQITATGSNVNPAQIARRKTNAASGKSSVKSQPVNAGLVNVPEDHNIRKFPVRIFDVQIQD